VDDLVASYGVVAAVGEAPDGTTASGPRRLELGPLTLCLVVEGLPIGDLPPGARLRVGAAAVVELGPPGARGSAAGVLETGETDTLTAVVIEGGPVEPGDRVVLEAVAVPLSDVLDLHSFRPEDAPKVVAEYLDEARRAGLGEVRLVHGRGRGVQRAVVRRLLAATPGVADWSDAPPTRGGWGATVVRLEPAGPSGDSRSE
jgi:hypothetical protein